MAETIRKVLAFWGIGDGHVEQIYSSAWEINHAFVMKVYHDKKALERNLKLTTILRECDIPVAEIVPSGTGQKYVEYQNSFFLLTRKLKGSNLTDIKDEDMARKMGCSIARLHRAFAECEKEFDFWDNSLLREMKGWIRDNLEGNDWTVIDRRDYMNTLERLEGVYGGLPEQLIHRDVHFGNFLFHEGELSGYIDFDLSQRNIRIFDICYFLAGLLAEETDSAFTKEEWLGNVRAVVAGYESILALSEEEKDAIPCVMECIEILFAAYFIGLQDAECAKDAYRIFLFLRECEGDIVRACKEGHIS